MAIESDANFTRPNSFERILNRAVGAMFGLGFGLAHNYLLQVPGRKSGRLYSTPVDLLETGGKLYLVCPRGRAQWVRNVEASGRVFLKKRSSRVFAVTAVPDHEKAPILKEYLDRFATTVQRYFPVAAGSPVEAFAPYLARYPVFELTPPETT